jgi:hypothetical protein
LDKEKKQNNAILHVLLFLKESFSLF